MALDLLAERPRCPICGQSENPNLLRHPASERQKAVEMSDLGKSGLMAYRSGRTMVAKAGSTIEAKIPPETLAIDFIGKPG
jgi:hypothetical protein